MTNPYYNPTGTPGTGAQGASQPVRLEFTAIANGFALLPTVTGNGNKAVVVNAGGTALTVTTGSLALAGDFATTGAFNTTFAQTATTTLTLPAVTGTLATLAGTETLSNKTLVAPALGTPTSGVLTNCTGTASGLTSGVTLLNANLSGPIASVGNSTSVTAQTGTGTTFVMNTGPTITTLVVSSGGAAITGNTSVSSGTFTASGGAFAASPASANVVLSPTGTGVVTINPATAGTMNNVVIGGSTPAAITGTTITDSVGNVRSIIHSGSDKTTTYSLLAADNGQYISLGASGAITIPNSTFADGNVVTIFNNTASSATITCNTTTCYAAGINTNKGGGGTLALATRGTCTILFLGSTSCLVSGNVL